VAFTEHADLTPWVVRAEDPMSDVLRRWLRPDGRIAPRDLDVEGYLDCFACEINTKVPLAPELVRWWGDAGGESVSFGSDAHRPRDLARGFSAAAEVALSCGFRPGSDPADLWLRVRQARPIVA
jgi:hypothetical protein